jgi:hypothetical protein
MTSIPSFAMFRNQALAEGFDEILERIWPPDTVVPSHTHPFSLRALVVQGEMWLTVGDRTQHLLSGQTFELERNEEHAERYGASGATY